MVRRLLRHLCAPSARRWFPPASLQRIAAAIAASERGHGGEICFAIEPRLALREVMAGRQARDRALDVFAQLRVWDTRDNTGVLLYLLLADHRIEIVADRGFDDRVSTGDWREVCAQVERGLRSGAPEAAVLDAVATLDGLLVAHFPRRAGDHEHNEVPDQPHLL